MIDDIVMVPRASLWQRFRHQLRLLGRVAEVWDRRPATAEEAELIRAHAIEQSALRAQVQRLMFTIEDRDEQLGAVKDELAQSKSIVKLREREIEAMAAMHGRLRTMIAADNAELAVRVATAELARDLPALPKRQ